MPASLTASRVWEIVDARFDRFAIGIGSLCFVHCLATTILLTVLSTAGGLLDPRIHEVGLGLAILFGVVALGRGIFTHGYMMPAAVGGFGLGVMAGALSLPHGEFEIIWTLIGVSLLALGHDLNHRATH